MRRPKSYVIDGKKFCLSCETEKPFEDFNKNPNGIGGLQPHCRSCQSSRNRQWRRNNVDRVRDYNRHYNGIETNENENWGRIDPIREKAYAAIWFNKERADDWDGTLTVDFLVSIYRREDCHYCGLFTRLEDRTQDHYIPFTRGGLNTANNIVMACRSCNSKKRTMTGDEYFEKLDSEAW